VKGLSQHEITLFFLSLGFLLAAARILGEAARRFQQPAVLGEILAGIILGPTVLGAFFPEWSATLFPESGGVKIALEGLTTLAIALFLLVAGMEVDLSVAWRQGKTALIVGAVGIAFPFAIGFSAAWFFEGWLVQESAQDPIVFSLFFATAMSISALPVIARILMDLNLYRTDLGMVIISCAILNDLIGWNIFSLILGMLDTNGGAGNHTGTTILMTLAFVVTMLTLGRWLFNRVLPWFLAHTSWPGGVLGFVLTLALFSAAATEWIGVHALFGAFMFGVAAGDSKHLRQRTRNTIEQFVSFIFAPIFFASIGLKVNFFTNFDPLLVVVVLVIATVGKVAGCGFAARWCGLPPREALAVGFGMNARGAMEIILGLLALEKGLIDERMFVALVVMALVTSLTSGTLIQRMLRRKKPTRFTDFLASSRFVPSLASNTREDAVRELAALAARGAGKDPVAVGDSVWEREQIMSTGLERGLAVPHARLPDLKQPILAAGASRAGIDFDALDGQPTNLIFLILTPVQDNGAQVGILADISRTFQDPALVGSAVQARNYTEFLALVKSHEPDRG
jgi:Kef-type K+ transport system membrane component KefB/mannitol/fructose-specific phosphotransferase system IIA component